MSTTPLPEDEAAEFASKGLDAACDPVARSATALFRLGNHIAAIGAPEVQAEPGADEGNHLRLWANRPGQNRVETVMLAVLAFWLVAGVIGVWLVVEDGGGISTSVVRWLITLAAAPALAFLALHALTAVLALATTGLQALGLAGHRPSQQVSLWLSLPMLTAIAAMAVAAGHPLMWVAAAPWLVWATLNFAAWIVLLLVHLSAALSHLSPEP